MGAVVLSRGGRRYYNARARNRYATVACTALVATLLVGAYGNDARASSKVTALVPQSDCASETDLASLLGISRCPESRAITNTFTYPLPFTGSGYSHQLGLVRRHHRHDSQAAF
jgi:hypothetical protein